MRTTRVNYYKPSLNTTITHEPFWRYDKQEIGFWDFLKLNFLDQLDYLCQTWLFNRGRFYHEGIEKKHITYQEVLVDLDKIVMMVLEQANLIEEIYHKQRRYLLLGCKQMQALQLSDYFQFSFPANYVAPLAGKPGIDKVFAGMQVVCIPWMDGMIVLPELDY